MDRSCERARLARAWAGTDDAAADGAAAGDGVRTFRGAASGGYRDRREGAANPNTNGAANPNTNGVRESGIACIL